MVPGGNQRSKAIPYVRKNGTTGEFKKLILSSEKIRTITKTDSIKKYINTQQENWVGHCIRSADSRYVKKLTFPDYYKGEAKKRGRLSTVYGQVLSEYKRTHEHETENDMIIALKNRNSLGATTQAHDSDVLT